MAMAAAGQGDKVNGKADDAAGQAMLVNCTQQERQVLRRVMPGDNVMIRLVIL